MVLLEQSVSRTYKVGVRIFRVEISRSATSNDKTIVLFELDNQDDCIIGSQNFPESILSQDDLNGIIEKMI